MTQPPLIPYKAAHALALAAGAGHFGVPSTLILLNPTAAQQASFVFRAGPGVAAVSGDVAAENVIIKIADPASIALAAARLAEVYPTMSAGRYRVPWLLAHDEAKGFMVMEDGRGQAAQRLYLSGAAGAAKAVAAAGGWLARFHKPTCHMGAFNPDPHLNWLHAQSAAHLDQSRHIPEFHAFQQALTQLDTDAATARGQPVLRCVTHRDFHLRNLLIRNLGRCYGIDFENAKRDEALRDLLFFTADAAKVAPAPPTADSLRAIAQPLRTHYARTLGAAISRRVFQTAFALAGWASLNTAAAPLGPNRERTLAVMQTMATTDDLFADP